MNEQAEKQVPEVAPTERAKDWFTPIEAAYYCHLDSIRSLQTLEDDYGLAGYKGLTRSKLYSRDDLDAAMKRFFGQNVAKSGLRIAK